MINTDSENPRGIVWLASYPKSGNTWLRAFLYHLVRIGAGIPREDDELNKLDRASGYEAKLFGLFQQFLGKPLAAASRLEVMGVRSMVQLTVAERMPNVAMMKTHNLLGEVGGMPTINFGASAGAIYIVRDPRDVAPSLAKHLGTSIDQAIEVMATPAFATNNNAETAFEIWGTWSEHVESWTQTPNPSVLVVRYEDMLDQPTEIFGRIAAHLKQEPTEDQLAEAIELSSFDKLKQLEDKGEFRERSARAERFFVSGKAGSWRDKLTEEQAERVLRAHSAVMSQFGYG
ncbi:MAG TPA: sulfotransferase domain-containing protein [Bauldia sp.]|nr:sulfotransferase domain-containing protein [Bauldia sp.]